MNDMIGWIGSFFLAICAIPQAYHSFKTKSSKGIDNTFLILWFLGEVFTMFYLWPKQDWPLITNYAVNFVCLSVIAWYKIVQKTIPK